MSKITYAEYIKFGWECALFVEEGAAARASKHAKAAGRLQ